MEDNENLFDHLFDGEESTCSGNEDPLDKIHQLCLICGGINGEHSIDCEYFLTQI